jgi:hypothetical protein
MSYQHSELAAGRWSKLTLIEQMANIGSEVERALNWRQRSNSAYSQRAFERALELIDLALANTRKPGQLKEIARLREALVDDIAGRNEYSSTDASWKKYFAAFLFAARRNH